MSDIPQNTAPPESVSRSIPENPVTPSDTIPQESVAPTTEEIRSAAVHDDVLTPAGVELSGGGGGGIPPGTDHGDDDGGGGDDDEERMTKMSFLEHLEELRQRIINSLIAIAGGFGVCFWF